MRKLLSVFLTTLLLCGILNGCNEEAAPKPILNGVNLSEYAIVYSDADRDYALRAAEYIRDQILERTGLELPIQEDSQVTATYEIVVGDTERQISQTLDIETDKNQFALMASGNQIGLEGDYFYIAAAAYYFVETYIPGKNFQSQIPAEATLLNPITEKPTHYIFLIGDGMGFHHTLLHEAPPVELNPADGFWEGEDLFYGYLFPAQGSSRTVSLSGVTDSAAGGTALASGYKTYNGSVGLDKNEHPVVSLTELATSRGMATAVLSTETQTGATPASFSAHATSRDDNNSIYDSQMITAQNGTLISCGFDVYDSNQLTRRLEKKVADALTQLDQDPDGFFLMYEEAHIDKHSHSNDIENAYLCMVRFNQAIGRFMEYACYHPDTFVLITADHETGDLKPDENGIMAYHHDDHTDQDVPVFVYGQGSELFNGVNMENTQIPKTIAKMWGVDDFGDNTTEPALS